jgi:DNA-binding NtrC family response regulator
MQSREPATTVVFVGARRPDAAIEQEMDARGIRVELARSIKVAAGLLHSALGNTVVITELALVDGNWRDLVEQIRCLGPIPIVLLTSASTAELWWDALECGVEDILMPPLSASRLCQFLKARFQSPK